MQDHYRHRQPHDKAYLIITKFAKLVYPWRIDKKKVLVTLMQSGAPLRNPYPNMQLSVLTLSYIIPELQGFTISQSPTNFFSFDN